MGLKKHFMNELGHDLNREIVEEIKRLREQEEADKETIRQLNAERIRALGLRLILGGKQD